MRLIYQFYPQDLTMCLYILQQNYKKQARLVESRALALEFS